MGISPDGLAKTVELHNAAISRDEIDPMGKPGDFTRPIESGPFTLLEVSVRPKLTSPCPMFTLGGLLVNEDTGAVTSAAGEAIPGLYAGPHRDRDLLRILRQRPVDRRLRLLRTSRRPLGRGSGTGRQPGLMTILQLFRHVGSSGAKSRAKELPQITTHYVRRWRRIIRGR